MQKYQKDFIEFAIANRVLCFGDYVLKSGRNSPYFFNAGLFNDGSSLARLGRFYASAIMASGIEFDMLFGPAYKGIPLASSVAIALAGGCNRNVRFCFNRKERKEHGEGGMLFGANLKGRVLIVDDVISAGTSVNLSVQIIRQAGAVPAGVAIALDRQERGSGGLSAVQEVEQCHGIRVISVVTLDQVINYLETMPDQKIHLEKIREYRRVYGSRQIA
jgi:orotate phosphoribosyltransferase